MFKAGGNLIAIACLISGCSAMPPLFGPPPLNAEIPENWLADNIETDTNTNHAWWTTFEDPDLNAAIVEAVMHNHDLRTAAARIEIAEADARITGANLYPQAQTELKGSKAKQVLSINPLFGARLAGSNSLISFTSNTYGVSLAISWELDVWGRIRSGGSAAIGNIQAQQNEYKAAALSLAAQTAKAWFAATEAQPQLNLANETVESFRKTARQASNPVDAGVQSPTDKHLTAANLASAEALGSVDISHR